MNGNSHVAIAANASPDTGNTALNQGARNTARQNKAHLVISWLRTKISSTLCPSKLRVGLRDRLCVLV